MQERLGCPWLSFHYGYASSPLAAIIELAVGDCFPLIVRLSRQIKGEYI